MASKKKDSGAKTGTKTTGAKTGGKKVKSPFFNKPVTEISNANKFAQAVAPKTENKTIPSAPKTQTFKQAVESPASYAKNLEGTPSQDAVIRANTGKTQVYNTGKKKTLWEEKYGIILPKDFMKDMASVQNPYAGNRAVDAGNEAAALEARALTGEDRNPDHQKIADLRQEAEVNSSPYVKAYREAKNPKGRKETAAKFRKDNADELYLKPMLEGAKTDYQRNKQKMPNGANAEEYLRKIAPYRLRSKENKLTETEKREIVAITEPFITRIDSGRFNSDDAKKLKKYLNAIADRIPDDDIAGNGFINALKNRVDSAGTVAKKAEEQKRTNENFEKYIAPALSNPSTYYFPKDASFDDYIDAADSIISQMYSGSGISEEEKAQLYSIITQYKAKIEKTVSKDDPNRNGYYRRMAEILNPNDSDRRDFFSEEDRTFLSWLEDKSLKDYTSVITAAQREKEQKKAQEEYKKYIAPVLSDPRTYYFPKDAKPSDYIRAAQKITNKMKWDGTSSDETKKQLYSIIEQFMLKYPDPDNKLLDKELRGEGRTTEECYLNMRYIIGDHPGRSDGSYSKEDKKFVEYLSKKLSNEISLTKNEKKLEKAEEKKVIWSGENSEGEKITLYRDKNFFNSNWNVGNLGIIASRMGDMYAKTGDKRFYDLALKFKQLSEGVAGANYEDINPDNIFLNIAANGLQSLPLQLDQLKETGKIAAPLALLAVATGVGTIGGALKLAYTAGSVKSGFEIMRGDAMVSLTEMGLSYDDALKLANNEGFINAFIESGDAVLDITSFGAGGALMKQTVASLTGGVKKGAARAAAKGLLKLGISEKGVKTILKGAAAAGAFALDVAGEGAEEWMQTSVSMANEDAAEAILSGDSNAGYESASNLVDRAFTRDYTKEEKAQRWEDFWGGVKGGLFFSGAHIAAGALLGGGTNFANSSAMNISSGEMVKTNNLEEQTLAESAKIQDKDVQKYRQKIVNLIASGQEVRTDEWGKLYNLAKAAEAKASAETLKEQYRDLGKTSNLTFEQAREAMAKDPASETLDPGDAFLAFTQGRYEKKKGAAKKANVETESAKAVKTAKENEAKTAESAKTTEKTAATDNEARSDIGKKSSGENKKRLLESIPEENREEAEYYWGLGRAGEEMKTVYDEPFAGGTLSDLERVQAWSAGKNDRKLYLEEVERESTYGLSDSDETRVNLNDIDKTTARFLDAAAKKLGVTVEIRGILGNSAGNRVGGFTEDGSGNVTFTMNAAHKKLKGKALAMYFATHEFVHSVRIKSGEAYNKLVNAIGAEILTDERIAAKIAEYAESHIEIDTEAAKEEIVAEYVGEALAKADKKTIHKIIGGRRNVAEVLLDLVNKLIDLFRKDKELREGYKNAREAIIEAMESIDRERAQRIKEGRTESTKTDENVKYAVNDNYKQEINSWYKSGKSKNESFILGSTGDVLQGLGAIESDIYINSEKVLNILEKHKEITIDEIKKIPDIIENPVLILKSKNKDRGGKQNTRLIIYGSVKGKDGRPVLSVLDLRPVENNLAINDMQKVSSVYTKDNNPVAFIENSDVVYADKKRTANLLHSIGFQMPTELRHSGYIGSISYRNDFVNIQGKKFSDVFDVTVNTQYMQNGEKYAVSDDSGAENGKASDGDGKKKEKYFKPGSNRARDIDIVSETENGRKNPRLMRNLAESQFTSEETASEIAEEARSGNYSFTSYSDKAAASQVNRWFASHGNDILRAGNDVLDLLKAGKVTDKTNVMKALLTLSKIEDKRMTGEVSPEMSRLGEEIRRELYTASGETARALQAYSTAKKLSPEGEIEELERKISDINKEHEKKAGDDRWKKIEDAERGLKSADETVRDAEENADFIGRKVAEKERQIKETAKTHRDFREIDKEYLPIRDDADPEEQAKKFKKQIEQMKGKTAGTNEWLDAYNSYLADEFSKASKRLAEAREANREAREERKRLEKAIPGTERKEYETFWKTELTKRDSEYLKGELAEASKRLAETNAELKKARDKYRELLKEVNRVKATMARREKSIALSNRKIADIRTETEKLLSDYKALLDEQAEAETELTKARMSRKLAKELFEAANKYTKRKKIVLSEELRQKILNAKTEEEREELRKEAMKDIAGQLPPTVWESLRAWRYLAMLGNLRTHIRNCVGNTIQLTAVGTKNLIAGGISDIYFHGEGPGALNEYMEFLRADGGTVPAGSVNREDFNAVRGKNVGALTDSELESLKSPARKYYEEMGTKSPFFRAKSGDWREYDTTEVLTATKARRDEKGRPIVTGEVKNSDTGWSVIVSPRISEATEHGRGKAVERNAEYMPYIHDAVKKAVLVSSKISDSESGISLMEHDMYAYVTAKGRTELLKLTVEEKGSGSSGIRDYVLKDVAPVAFVKTEAGKSFTVADVFKKVKETDRDFEYKKADKSKLNKDGSVKTPKERYNTIVHSKFDKETRQWIYTLWKEQKSEIMSGGGGKYKGITSEIEDLRKKAGPEIINWMAEKNSGALEWEDGKFLLSNFYIAMRQYLSANKLNKNNITDEQLTRAIEHSTKEALEATYRDMNNLARFFRDMCKRSKLASFLIDATVPFTTTPFNIVKRAVEYSPLECLVMVKKGIDSAFGKGEYNAADVINDIAKMTSGTGLAALGACLYASGYLVIGDGSDDDDEYKKELGMQPFSIIINGRSYTLDWAAPAVIPLFMGAQITKLMSKASEDGELTAKEKVKAIETSIDVFLAPMLQMSVLTSLTDTMEAIRSGDSVIEGIAEVASQAVINYLGQYVPTALGQVARTVDPSTRRTVFVQKDAPFYDAEYFLKKQMGKIPGLSRLNPEYVDLFGETAPRKEGIGDYVQSALSNMVYPWYMADVTRTESDDELLRLSGTAAADRKKVLNYRPEKTVDIDIGGHTEKRALTEDEYFEIKKKMGQYGTAAIRELIKSDIYKDMSDEARAEATDFIWSTAEKKAKADVVPDFYMSKEERIAESLSGGDPEKLANLAAALAKDKLAEEEANPDYTEEQQRKYDSSLEERFSALSDELTASPYWEDKSDEERHEALTDLYGYSAAKARSEVEEGYELSGKNKKIASAEEKTGLSAAEYLAYKLLEEDADTDGSGTLNQKETSAALREFALQNGASLSDVAFLWQMETDGVSRNNPWAAYLDPKYYKHSGKEKKTWDR